MIIFRARAGPVARARPPRCPNGRERGRRHLLAAVALPAAAGEPRAAGEPVLVLAAFPGAGGIDKRAIDLVVAHIRPVGVRLQIVRPGTPRPVLQTLLPEANALADTWDARECSGSTPGRATSSPLYVVERDGEQIYGRRIPVLPRTDARPPSESLANIAGAVAEELREGHVAGLAEVKVAPVAPAPAAPPEPDAAPEPAASPAAPAAAAHADAAPDLRPPAGPPSPSTRARREASPLPTFAVLAGYTGANFSSAAPWQSAAALRASWAPVDYAVLGLGYELDPLDLRSAASSPRSSSAPPGDHDRPGPPQAPPRPRPAARRARHRRYRRARPRGRHDPAGAHGATTVPPPPGHGPPPPPPWRWPADVSAAAAAAGGPDRRARERRAGRGARRPAHRVAPPQDDAWGWTCS